jgi:hypothetical protein
MIINTTIEIDKKDVIMLQDYLSQNLKVLDFKVIPDTTELYKKDKSFQKLCKCVKDAQLVKDRYWNENRT